MMILPVIHYADDNQAMRNAERAFAAGCPGVMLIEMRGRNLPLPGIGRSIKRVWPDKLVGLNFLNATTAREMPCSMMRDFDMTWTDEQLTHSEGARALEALWMQRTLSDRPDHLLFCAVAFKYQAPEPDPVKAALDAIALGFIPTTSGPATGQAADPAFVADLFAALGPGCRLAIASGITPDNVAAYAPNLTHALVSTGVSSSFHEFDPARLAALMEAVA